MAGSAPLRRKDVRRAPQSRESARCSGVATAPPLPPPAENDPSLLARLPCPTQSSSAPRAVSGPAAGLHRRSPCPHAPVPLRCETPECSAVFSQLSEGSTPLEIAARPNRVRSAENRRARRLQVAAQLSLGSWMNPLRRTQPLPGWPCVPPEGLWGTFAEILKR